MTTRRRVLQLLPAQLGSRGEPVFRVAYHEAPSLCLSPVVAWALVQYMPEGQPEHEAMEPVSRHPETGHLRIGRTDDPGPGRGDVVLAPGEDAVWSAAQGLAGHIEIKASPDGKNFDWATAETPLTPPVAPPKPLG
jgi:hypothetical protein